MLEPSSNVVSSTMGEDDDEKTFSAFTSMSKKTLNQINRPRGGFLDVEDESSKESNNPLLMHGVINHQTVGNNGNNFHNSNSNSNTKMANKPSIKVSI